MDIIIIINVRVSSRSCDCICMYMYCIIYVSTLVVLFIASKSYVHVTVRFQKIFKPPPEGRRGEWLDYFPEGQLHVHVIHTPVHITIEA